MSAIEHRHLRSALEFAVLIAEEGRKRRPPLAFPKELKPLLSKQRLPASALGRVRRAVEGDPNFRRAIAAGALPELVDEVGRLWLEGSDGWEDAAAGLVAEQEAEAASSDLRADLKRAEKRRTAAEQAAARIQVVLLHRDATIAEQAAELDDLRADVAKATEALAEVRAELIDTRNEIRHARDREAAALARAEALAADARATRNLDAPTKPATDRGDSASELALGSDGEATADVAATSEDAARSESAAIAEEARRRLAAAADASREFTEHLESLLAGDLGPATAPVARRRRTPIALPSGVISTSAIAARHLVTAGAPIFVDGYNVAKLAWPDRTLEQQREALIARVEDLVRRHGATVTVVFDGRSVAGAHARGRRQVRVVYSPCLLYTSDAADEDCLV